MILKGTQHVVQFAFEGWWMADLQSFLANTPSTLKNIEVLEDAELLLINHDKQDNLLREALNTANTFASCFKMPMLLFSSGLKIPLA